MIGQCQYLHYSTQIGHGEGNKPSIWIDAGIHAREWIAPATAVYMISQVQFIQGDNILYLTIIQ